VTRATPPATRTINPVRASTTVTRERDDFRARCAWQPLSFPRERAADVTAAAWMSIAPGRREPWPRRSGAVTPVAQCAIEMVGEGERWIEAGRVSIFESASG
jgi:hypothetical protein